jgi:hypothetical protein
LPNAFDNLIVIAEKQTNGKGLVLITREIENSSFFNFQIKYLNFKVIIKTNGYLQKVAVCLQYF